MATTERNPKANTFPSNDPITTLRGSIAAGNDINASDITSLIGLINNWLGHFHTYDDFWQIPTYGNNGDRTTYVEDKNAVAIGGSVTGVTAGDIISAAKHNEMRTSVAALGSHFHSIDDH